jgi:hypothetical protein
MTEIVVEMIGVQYPAISLSLVSHLGCWLVIWGVG